MQLTPSREEIDHRTIKLLIGAIAILLAALTSFFADPPIASISAAYFAGDWPRTLFVGLLFAIAAFLSAYNGESRHELLLSKLACAAALCVALFPCGCDDRPQIIPYFHYIAATVMFLVLAGFCYIFFKRAKQKGYPEAKMRAAIYMACGVVIIGAIFALAYDALTGEKLRHMWPRFVFYGEAVALVAFGVSWLTASRVFPGITTKEERFSPLG